MTEKEFKALLKIEGKRMIVKDYLCDHGWAWHGIVKRIGCKAPEKYIQSSEIWDAPKTRKEAVQMLIKVCYDGT